MLVDKEKIAALAQNAIRDRVFPGCVIGVASAEEVILCSLGGFTYDDASERVNNATIYDVASVTKSIPLASLAALLIDEGAFLLGDPIKKFIPELQNDYGATIEDLLRYRVRGSRLSTLQRKTSEEISAHIFETGFDGPAGVHAYANVPAYVLGVIVERVSGMELASLAHTRLFAPLCMTSTTFFPARSDCAPTEIDADGNEIRGIVHDESARVFSRARRPVGHAGLFSTAPDLTLFAQALLQNRYPHIGMYAERGLGWSVSEPYFMGTNAGDTRFGKTGFTGASIMIDRRKRTAVVILSNRTYPKRPIDATSTTSAINVFRSAVADIVFA